MLYCIARTKHYIIQSDSFVSSRREQNTTPFLHLVDGSSAVVLLSVNDNGTVALDHGRATLLEGALDESDGAETSPDEEDGRLEVTLVGTDHVGGDDGDDGVPEPVGGGGEGNTTRADGEREDLTDEDPGTRTPCGGEEEDEDGDERNLGVDGRDVVGTGGAVGEGGGVVESLSDTDDGNQELADQHTESTEEEECTATELLHSVEGKRGGADVDEGEDERDQEGVGDGASRLQEGSGVVEEAVGPARDPATGGDKLALVLLVGNDLSKLEFNHGPELSSLGVGRVDTTDLHQSLLGLFGLAALDEVTRRVGKASNTTTEDKTPGKLDTDGDAVLASVTTTLDAVVDTGGKQETNGNAELVTGDERTTDLLGANLGHVENDNGRLETDTNTGDGTTSDKEVTATGSHLQNNSDDVDETSQDNGP